MESNYKSILRNVAYQTSLRHRWNPCRDEIYQDNRWIRPIWPLLHCQRSIVFYFHFGLLLHSIFPNRHRGYDYGSHLWVRWCVHDDANIRKTAVSKQSNFRAGSMDYIQQFTRASTVVSDISLACWLESPGHRHSILAHSYARIVVVFTFLLQV